MVKNVNPKFLILFPPCNGCKFRYAISPSLHDVFAYVKNSCNNGTKKTCN